MDKKFLFASIDILLFIVLSMILDIFLYTIYGLSRYLIALIFIQIIIWIISLVTYFSKKSIIYNMGIFITFLVNIVSIYYIFNYNKQYSLVNGLIFNKYKYINYELYIKKGTTHSKVSELKDKTIGIMDDNYDNVCSEINNKINVECKKYYYFEDLIKALNNYEIQAILVTDLHSDSNLINSDYKKLDDFHVKYEK